MTEPNIIYAGFQGHAGYAARPKNVANGTLDAFASRFSGDSTPLELPQRAPPRYLGAMAKLYFHYATMNAGKSTMLLQASYNYRERGMNTLLMVAGHYRNADGGYISSRIGLESGADMFRDGDDLFELVRERHDHHTIHCVFVDEAQFLEADQVWQLARVADRLGIPVMCYGLRTDFQGNLFSGSKALLAIADELREVRTICRCGRKATMVVRMGPDGRVAKQGDQVAIGKNVYVSLCRRHWEEEMGRMKPDDMIGFGRN